MDMFIYERSGKTVLLQKNVQIVPNVGEKVEVLVTTEPEMRVAGGLVIERSFRFSDEHPQTGVVHVHLK